MKSGYWRVVGAILWKDIWMEFRRPEVLPAMIVFAILAVFLFNFTLEFQPALRTSLVPGLLWLTITFSGTLGINRCVASEKDRGSFDGLLLAPVERHAIFLGKTAGVLCFLLVMEGILIGLFSLFYNVNLFQPALLGVCILASLGFVSTGIFMGSIAVQTKSQEIILPVLLLPVSLPLLIAAVKASSATLDGSALVEAIPWLNILIVYDLVFIALALMIFDVIVEE